MNIEQQQELFRALGRIEAGLSDVMRRLEQNDERHARTTARIGSLERSRTRLKAWSAGAMAVSTAAASIAVELYHVFARTK